MRQSQNAITIAVASLLVVFILSSTLFIILSCACGWVGHTHKTERSDKNACFEGALLYEDFQPSTPTSNPGEQERATFELKFMRVQANGYCNGPIRIGKDTVKKFYLRVNA